MVVISLPAASATRFTHERIASPSRWTVQAPHCAMPQPYFVPVKPSVSRNTHSSGVAGSTSAFSCLPLTLRVITMRVLPLRPYSFVIERYWFEVILNLETQRVNSGAEARESKQIRTGSRSDRSLIRTESGSDRPKAQPGCYDLLLLRRYRECIRPNS